MRIHINDLFDLANKLKLAHRYGEAEQAYRAILSARPEDDSAAYNLALTLLETGRSHEAVALLRPRLRRDGSIARALLFQLPYAVGLTLRDIAAITREIVDTTSPASGELLPAPRNPSMRVGWLSADLRAHVIARTILPVIRELGKLGVHHHFYSDVAKEDDFTAAFKGIATRWRDVRGLADAEVCGVMRADHLDALFLLAARCDENRPFFAALRAAPVQISLHDNATSALPNMDYFVADRFLVPRSSMGHYSERVLRLPSFYVHEPLDAFDLGAPPSVATGLVTFGCFNNPPKISDAVLDVWAQLLSQVEGARRLLKYRDSYDQPGIRAQIIERLGRRGVASARIGFLGRSPNVGAHLADYRAVDVALDPYPYSGVTTTFEALWMGVPVVTMTGETVASRQAASMLRTLGLEVLVTDDATGYISAAADIAGRPEMLLQWRSELRERLQASPICDPSVRARQIYRLLLKLTKV